jgi:TPR repeat protein
MRISKLCVAAVALIAIGTAGLGLAPYGGAASLDRDVLVAYNASTTALKRRDFSRAIPDLKYAADHGVFLAQYYLARLYAMPGQSFTNNAGAFDLLRKLVKANRDVDPDLDNRALFVARAEILLAYYYRHGVPEMAVPVSLSKAKAHLEHAALRLQDVDAQFELGRLDLENAETVPRGLDTLDNLATTRHHAAAAAEIAQVFAQGRLTERAPYRALAYAMLASKLATGSERLDIGDMYQLMYCQTGPKDRTRAEAFFHELDQSERDEGYGPITPITPQRHATVEGVLDLAEVNALRVCANGEAVPQPGMVPGVAPLPGKLRSPAMAAANTRKGFNSPVGFIAPPMGMGLKDLEQPQEIGEDGEPAEFDDTDNGPPSN